LRVLFNGSVPAGLYPGHIHPSQIYEILRNTNDFKTVILSGTETDYSKSVPSKYIQKKSGEAAALPADGMLYAEVIDPG